MCTFWCARARFAAPRVRLELYDDTSLAQLYNLTPSFDLGLDMSLCEAPLQRELPMLVLRAFPSCGRWLILAVRD